MEVCIKIDKKIINLLKKADLNEKKQKIINQKSYKKNLKPYTKTNKKVIKFDDTEIVKYKFYQNQRPILV